MMNKKEPVVVVNGEVITRGEIDRFLTRYIIQLEEEDEDFIPSPEKVNLLKGHIINLLIDRVLLIQRARELNVSVSDDEVEVEFQSVRNAFDSDEEFERHLGFFKSTVEDLRREIKEDKMVGKLIDLEVGRVFSFGEEELRNYYEANKRWFLEDVKYDFLRVLIPGEILTANLFREFSSVMKNSDDGKSIVREINNRGGKAEMLIGKKESELPDGERKVLFDLEEGEIGSIPGESSLTMIKLVKRQGRQRDFEEVKDDLRNFLYQKARAEIYDNLVDELFNSADLEFVASI